MIKYEVNLELNPSIYEDFLAWLPGHIEEIMALQGFKNAYILTEHDNGVSPKITVHYIVASMPDLQNYFDHHASIMRNKTVELFGDQFKANRRILEFYQEFH